MSLFFILQNPEILDATAKMDKTIPLLTDLYERVDELTRRSLQYKGYQKNFKVEVTKFEELEEVFAEIKLKQLLWDSLANWEEAHENWLQVI